MLSLVDLDPSAGDHLVEPPFGELAVVGKGAHGIVDVSVDRVGELPPLEDADELDHLGDVLGRARLVGRGQAAERRHVAAELGDILLRELADRDPARPGTLDHPVVDVGDVADERDVVARGTKPTVKDVERDPGAAVPDVAAVVDRDPAQVGPHLRARERLEALDAAAQRVVKDEGYLSSPE